MQQSEAVSLLAEMFPTVSMSELVHHLSLAAGSLDVAAQHLLESMDSANEQCSSPVELPASVFSCPRTFIKQKFLISISNISLHYRNLLAGS